MRHFQEPLTMAKHPQLLKEINELSLAIKIHHFDLSKEENQEAVKQARASTFKPTWENVANILDKCYQVINRERENPVKY